MNNTNIYLDCAAATPLDPDVLAAMQPYFAEKFYNPSALYMAAKQISDDLSDARAIVAKWLGARPGEVIFTAGGTEANNLAIHGVMQKFPEGKVLVSAIEHESVLEPARRYHNQEIAVKPDGRIDLADLEKSIDDQTVLISVMYANNEIGTVQPIRDISKIVRTKNEERRMKNIQMPLLLHTDAAQAGNYLDLHAARLGVDLMTINGGKIYGPKQSGVLYVRAGVEIKAQTLGGGQEFGVRSGTENVAGAIGLAMALDKAQRNRRGESERLAALQKTFFTELSQKIPSLQINGSQKYRLPNNIHITIPGQDNERLIMALDQAGIQAAAGSACSASNDEPSHVLRAIGLTEKEAQASLRFSLGRGSDEAQIAFVVERLSGLIHL